MGFGATVRRMFGRHERFVSELWRAGFIDLDQFVARVRNWAPDAGAILEIGCGEGSGTERLAAAYPDASILAIDIAPNLGRLFAGRSNGVTFRQIAVTELAKTDSGKFDLIVMCDVLHHVPPPMRADILTAARQLLAPGGSFVFKDWGRTMTPIHWIAYAADRWLTGDRVRFLKPREAEALLSSTGNGLAVRDRTTIKPWRNNFVFLMQPQQ